MATGTLPNGAPLPGPASHSLGLAPVRPFGPVAKTEGGGAAAADGAAAPPHFAEWAAPPGDEEPEGIVDWSAVAPAARSSPSLAESGV